jgi:hypothetical protein
VHHLPYICPCAQVAEALRAFSIETVVSYSAKDETAAQVATGLDSHASMLAPL